MVLPLRLPYPASVISWRDELRAQTRFALPLIAVNLGNMGMGVVDILVVGRYATADVAAVSVGHGFTFLLLSFGLGVILAMDPMVSQAVGAGDRPGVARALQRGCLLSVVLTFPLALAMGLAGPLLTWMEQPPEIIPLAAGYAAAIGWSVFPFLLFQALRQTLQAYEQVRALLLTMVLANFANFFLDVIFVFGWERAGISPMGAVGAGWATSFLRWIMVACLMVVAWPSLKGLLWPFDPRSKRLAPLWRWMVLGFPVALQVTLEIGAFHLVTILMGWISIVAMAANQVLMVIISTTFMVPLGISMAAAVRVGHNVGRGDREGARQAAGVAVICGAGFMAAMGLILFFFSESLARAFTFDPAVVALAVAIIPIGGVFQVFDGIQVVAGGALRGLGDLRFPAVVNLLVYWVIGLPLGLYLAFGSRDLLNENPWPNGLWWGMAGGLVVAAVVLTWRLSVRLSGDLSRLVLDQEEIQDF